MRHGAILAFALAGCFSPSRSLVGEPLPEEVDYTALLFADIAGHVFDGTGLVKREPGDAIGVPLPETIEDASSVRLLGFTAEDLARVGFSDAVAEEKLDVASPEQPALPAPIWYGMSQVVEGEGTLERASDPPFVTAPWLAACPMLVPGESRLVDSTCHTEYCALTAQQSGCAFSIRAGNTGCGPSMFDGRIDADGELVIDGCQPTEHSSAASAAIECEGIRKFTCKIEVHAQPEAPRISVTSVPLYSATETPPAGISTIVVGGYLFGLEVFDDRVVVASDAGRVSWEGYCGTPEPGLFHFLDPDTLEVIGTASSPPCVRDLRRVPNTDEFFAVFGAEDARSLGRFAKDGTMLESAPIPERAGQLEYPFSIVVHRLSDRVSIALGGDGVQYHSFHRMPALAFEWSSQVLYDMANHQEREMNALSILEKRQDELHVLDPTKPPADDRNPNYPSNGGTALKFREICEDILVRPERMLFLPGEGWLLASRDTRTGLIAILSLDASRCSVVRWFEGPSEIFDLALWPPDPNLVLAGIRHADTGAAYVALMSRTEARFLTGAVEAGVGAIDDMRAAANGRVYFTLPWSGSVAYAQMR